MTQLETERLILRTWKLEDFDEFANIHADPEVMRFIGVDGKPMSRFEAWRAFSSVVGHWSLRGFGMFAVIERSSGLLAGRVGPWFPEGWPDFEVGWTLARRYWGRGYASEAVKACITYSFKELGRSHVISLIDPDNVRSIAVAGRVGERLEGHATLPLAPDKVILQYGVRREDWPHL
jgi:RimJ/RimL family protein N-acetyltransferase